MPRILVADDSAQIRSSLIALLTNEEIWVICAEAANGEQAVTLAQQLKPDLIVLDFAMPVMDGLAAAAEILKLQPSVPIVLFTLHKSEHLERTAQRIGIRRVISKSDSSKVLLENLREVWDESAKTSPVAPGSDSPPKPNQAAATDDAPPGC